MTGFLAALLGWQINLVSIHRGIERGRTASFLVGFGATTADMIFILIALGAGSFLDRPQWWTPLKWIGIVTLFSVGLHIILKKRPREPSLLKKKKNPTKNFLIGFLIVIGNPAVFLLWLGIMSFILTHFSGSSILRFHPLFLIGFLFGSLTWFLILSFGILYQVENWGEKGFQIFEKVCALLLLVAGLFLIFEKF